MDLQFNVAVVGEHSISGEGGVRPAGADGKANVGISNDNAGEKPAHRKTKVSSAMLISSGLVGS
jgi:hypothetical protein